MGRSKEFEENTVLIKAMELFWQQGYEKTSISELVEAMGIHRKSLYDTFGDKHALFLRVIDLYGEQTKARLESKTLKATTAHQAIQYIFDYMIETKDDEHWGCLFVNAATEMGPWDKEVAEKTEEAFRQTESVIASIVREGQASGEFSTQYDAETLSEILHNTLIGLRVLARTPAGMEKKHRIADFFLRLLHD